MIPKVIHLCWISGEPYPDKIKKCIDSWERVLFDYEIMVWDKIRVESIGSRYVNEAVLNRRYAFAADYIRFYALYTYGGIYLDSDVEVIKSFNDLLGLRYFIGKENSGNDWEPAIIGAEPGLFWMKRILQYWRFGRLSFTDIWGRPRVSVLPQVCAKMLKKYKIIDCGTINEWSYSNDYICRFPADWFSPKSWETLSMKITQNTYCIHHFTATWDKTMKEEIKLNKWQIVTAKIRRFASWIKHDIFNL